MGKHLGSLVAGNRTFLVLSHKNRISIVIDGSHAHDLGLRNAGNYAKFLEILLKWTTTIYRPVDAIEAARLIIRVQNIFTTYQLEAANEMP